MDPIYLKTLPPDLHDRRPSASKEHASGPQNMCPKARPMSPKARPMSPKQVPGASESTVKTKFQGPVLVRGSSVCGPKADILGGLRPTKWKRSTQAKKHMEKLGRAHQDKLHIHIRVFLMWQPGCGYNLIRHPEKHQAVLTSNDLSSFINARHEIISQAMERRASGFFGSNSALYVLSGKCK